MKYYEMEITMKSIVTVLIAAVVFWITPAFATDSHQHTGSPAPPAPAAEGEHGSMNHGSASTDGKFVHSAMADDVHTEFQIMDLASMNMKDPEGKTHHVMVTFMRGDEKIGKAAGKVKLIAPSGKEQVADLKDYGGGTFAANFTIDEGGKWGVICLFKEDKGKHTVKFWYEHHQM